MSPQPMNESETMSAIAARADLLKQAGQPAVFDVNVSRRNTSGVPQQLASFANATLEHIANPLRWLPQLLGGGDYILNVRHPDLPDRIGGPIGVNIDKTLPGMEPRAIDPRITRSSVWQGPTLVGGAFNEPSPGAPATHAGATVVPGLPWGPQITNGYGLPQPTQPQPQDRERELQAQLAEMRAQFARSEAESKARAELESERRANDARLREIEQRAERERQALETRFTTQMNEMRAAAAQAPRVDPAEGWKSLIAIVMPFIQQMITQQHETRLMMMKMSEEQNRRQIEAAEKQHQAQMEMIRAITAQKPGMSEELRMLIDSLQKQASGGGNDALVAMMTKQLEAMGMMNRMSVDLINTVADIQMGDSEHPVVGAIREAAGAMKTMMAGAKEAGQKVVQKKLPQGQQQGQRPLTQQQADAIRAQQVRAAQAAAVARAQAGKAPPPKGTQPPQPAPTQQPPPQQARPQPQPATPPPATEPEPVPVATFQAPDQPVLMQAPDGSMVTHFEVLKSGVVAMRDVHEIVDYFVGLKNGNELSLKQKLDEHGGSPWELFKEELGTQFIFANKDYLEELWTTLDARGIDEGWWPADEEEEAGETEPAEPEIVEAAAEPVAEEPKPE